MDQSIFGNLYTCHRFIFGKTDPFLEAQISTFSTFGMIVLVHNY